MKNCFKHFSNFSIFALILSLMIFIMMLKKNVIKVRRTNQENYERLETCMYVSNIQSEYHPSDGARCRLRNERLPYVCI